MSFDDVRSIVEFIYRGELNVGADHFASVLKIAEELQIRGLMEVSIEFKIKSVWLGFYCWSLQKCLKIQYTDTDLVWEVGCSKVACSVFTSEIYTCVESLSQCLILAVGCFCLVTQLLGIGCHELSNKNGGDFEHTWRIF